MLRAGLLRRVRLRISRARHGDVARWSRISGVSRETIYRIARGRAGTLDTLMRLDHAMGRTREARRPGAGAALNRHGCGERA